MTSLLFPACFLALAALSGLAAANGRRWALRLPLLAATPVLALAVWWQLSQRDGLPTGARPADGSALVASVSTRNSRRSRRKASCEPSGEILGSIRAGLLNKISLGIRGGNPACAEQNTRKSAQI